MRILLTLSFAVLCVTGTMAAASDRLRAVGHQRVHPVLIGNEHNPLVTVAIEVDEPGVRVRSLTFSLDGTDDLSDIQHLELFFSDRHPPHGLDALRNGKNYHGDRRAVLAELTVPFGSASATSAHVTFRDDRLLAPGTNYFWLSCRLRETAELSHKVDARCTQIDTSVGQVEPSDASPGVRKRIGFALRQRYDEDVHTSRIPALTTTPKGTLLCVYDLRRAKRRDLQEDIDIGLSRSNDGGKTWEPLRVIMDMKEYGGLPQNRNGCSDPGIVVDHTTGDVFCAAVWMWGKLGHHQWSAGGSDRGYEIGKSAQMLMVHSHDDGKTWSSPDNLTRRLKQPDWILLAPSPQAGITLRDGTLALPVEGIAAGDPANPDKAKLSFSSVIVSHDHGAKWKMGSTQARGCSECQVVELTDGSLLLNARSMQGTKLRSVFHSPDLGQTWQPHSTHSKVLIESGCNGSLIRVNTQRDGKSVSILLFTNCHVQTERSHQTIQVSFDEGTTWPEKYHLLLDEGLGNGYPSLTQIDNDYIGIVYEGSQAHLTFEKIAIGELLKR